MANQRIRYENSTDTGAREDADAIDPIVDAERVVASVQNRPAENLRYRTEIDRTALEELKYRMDEDIRWIITAGDTSGEATGSNMPQITEWEPDYDIGPPERGIFTLGSDVAIQPIQTIGTDNKDTFSWTWDDSVTVPAVTLQVDGNLLAAEGGDLVEFRMEYTATTSTLVVTKIGDPITTIHILVSDDGSKTVQDLYDEINGDADVTKLATLDWGVGNRNTVIDPNYTVPFAGTYDFLQTAEKEYHLLQDSALQAFFTADSLNPLADGDTLAIYYPYLVDPDDFLDPGAGTDGGRRQSCVTNTNVTLTGVMLFNTDREPEKIPLGIPICKRIGADLIFTDGTVIKGALTVSDPAVYIGENGYTLGRFSAATGAAQIGVAAHADAGKPPRASEDRWEIPLDDLQAVLEDLQAFINDKGSLNAAETVTEPWIFTPSGAGDAITATGGTSDGTGVVGTGTDAGSGVEGTGGTTDGAGGSFTGGSSDGPGVVGQGTGGGAGVDGTGGTISGGVGVKGTGGSNDGTGVFGEGIDDGVGGDFYGGVTGRGITALAGASAAEAGVHATGGATGGGSGVHAIGGAGGGKGVYAEGNTTGVGVDAVGGASGAYGVKGVGTSTEAGVYGQGGASGGDGVYGLGTVAENGVYGKGGPTAGGRGVVGDGGNGGGHGVEGTGTVDFSGVEGTGGPTSGTGVKGTGGVTNGPGVWGVGGATTGTGVICEGASDGPALTLVTRSGAPSSPSVGDIWYDTTATAGQELKIETAAGTKYINVT